MIGHAVDASGTCVGGTVGPVVGAAVGVDVAVAVGEDVAVAVAERLIAESAVTGGVSVADVAVTNAGLPCVGVAALVGGTCPATRTV